MIYAIRISFTKFRDIDSEKKISTIITIIFLLLIYFVLRFTGVPEPKHSTKRYDKIEWTRYRPKQIATALQSKPAKLKQNAQTSDTTPQKIKKIDLTKISENFDLFKLKDRAALSKSNLSNKKAVQNNKINIDINASSDKIFLPFSTSQPNFNSEKLPKKPGLARYFRQDITVKKSNQPVIQNQNELKYVSKPDVPIVVKKNTDNLVIQPISLDEIPDDVHRIMPKIFVDISKWMANNHTELPEVVKKFMSYDTLDLASKVRFTIEGRTFDLFLLCRESIVEIRICLIESNQVSMLIDKGFKKKSHFLRTGNINRKDNSILSFGTARETPSAERTQDFYKIFLSWWQSIKKNQS